LSVGVWFQSRLSASGQRYSTVTGKGFRPRRIDLGRWRYLTCALSLLLVFLITGVPFLMMLYASLLPFYQAPTMAAFESMSFGNYWTLFHNSKTIAPMINSTILGPAVATAVILIVALIAYFVHKTRMRGRKILDFLGFAPIAIPSVVLGATFFWFYLLVPLPIIGTLTIIGLAYLTKYMPVALRFVSASMMQIHSELDIDVELLLADIDASQPYHIGHLPLPSLWVRASTRATVRADDGAGRDRATPRLAPAAGYDLRPREAIPPRGDRFTDTVPESRETRLGQATRRPNTWKRAWFALGLR
jgi:ABC-type sulfate transport system permease component